MNSTAADPGWHVKLVDGARPNWPLLQCGDKHVFDFLYASALPNSRDVHEPGAHRKVKNSHAASLPMARNVWNRAVVDCVLKST